MIIKINHATKFKFIAINKRHNAKEFCIQKSNNSWFVLRDNGIIFNHKKYTDCIVFLNCIELSQPIGFNR